MTYVASNGFYARDLPHNGGIGEAVVEMIVAPQKAWQDETGAITVRLNATELASLTQLHPVKRADQFPETT